MRNYLWTVVLILISFTIIITSCDEMGQIVEPVVTDGKTLTEVGNVVFPDANLANKVRKALNLPAGTPIPKAQLARLTVLEAWVSKDTPSGQKISNLTGLEHATQLTELLLLNNQISDITPLSGLTHLELLDLYNNEISDITPLVQLTQLTQLNLGKNQVSNITPLMVMTQLTHLLLNNNQISDIAPLTELVNLEYLNLEGNPITDTALIQTLLEKNPNVIVE